MLLLISYAILLKKQNKIMKHITSTETEPNNVLQRLDLKRLKGGGHVCDIFVRQTFLKYP
jgi:hypothetical protein